MTSKVEKIRAAMGSARMTSAAIVAASGVPSSNVSVFLTDRHRAGEVFKHGDAVPHEFSINPDFKRGKKPAGSKPTRRPRRLKGFKAEQRARKAAPVKDVSQLGKRPAISALALDTYVGATDLLITTLQQEVEGIEANAALAAALANHERAAAMFKATRAA